jgi:hypothetical protein
MFSNLECSFSSKYTVYDLAYFFEFILKLVI